jgi:DNA repair ATPase RecN
MKSTKLSPLFVFSCIVLISGTLILSFLSWRVITIERAAKTYINNHNQIETITTSYTTFATTFQKGQSRIYGTDFQPILLQANELKQAASDAKSKLTTSSNPTITKQTNLANDILSSIQTTTSDIATYSTYLICISSVEQSIEDINEKIKNTPVSEASPAAESTKSAPKPSITGFQQVSQYLKDQSKLVNKYSDCFIPSDSLDILQDPNKTQPAKASIDQYATKLLSIAASIDAIVEALNNSNTAEANRLSQLTNQSLSELQDATPQSLLYITSPQIQTDIQTTNQKITDYNQHHQSIDYKKL